MNIKIRPQSIFLLLILLVIIGAEGIYLTTKGQAVALNNDIENSVSVKEKPIKGIPVLMYHRIEKNKDIYPAQKGKYTDNMAVTKEELKEQLTYLKSQGYETITFEQLYDYLKKGTEIPQKPIIISFDDGYLSTYLSAFEVLKNIGFKGEIGVVTGVNVMDREPGLKTGSLHFNWKQALIMQKSGVLDMQSHTVSHSNLATLDPKALTNELSKSKNSLEKRLSKESTTIIYPYGAYNEQVITEAKNLGYKLGVTIEEGINFDGENLMKIKRLCVKHGQTGEDIVKKIDGYIKAKQNEKTK